MRFCKGHHSTKKRRSGPVALWLALLLTGLGPWLTVGAEQFGDQSLGWTREQEAAVAGYLQRRLQRQGQVINDVWLEYWLAERTGRLRQASTASLGPVSVVTIDDRAFNAFALPGNVMGFNLGLWRTANTEAEFMSVMAHELAHLSLRHFNRLTQANRQQAWLALSGALVGIALTGANPELGAAAFLGSQAGALQQRLSFSRDMETEADDTASSLLADLDYDPNAGAEVFRRLQQQLSFQTGLSDYWQTHPLPADRVARLDGLNEATVGPDAPDHHYDVLRWHVNRRHLPEDSFAAWPERHRDLVETAAEGSELPAALLARPDPNLIYGWILHQAEAAGTDLTRARLQQLTELFPDFDPAWYRLARLTWSADEDEAACSRARRYLDRVEGRYLDALALAQQLASSCQPEREAEARALWFWAGGQENEAMNLVRRAIESPASASQLARLRQVLRQFERELNLLPR